MCVLVLVGVEHVFGAVVHVQRKCEPRTKEDGKPFIKRVGGSASMVVSQDGHALSLLC